MDNSFKIASWNVNGLSESKKRKDVFDYLRQQNLNIIFLQETHWPENMENFIRSSWGYNLFVAGTETNKAGVAIIISPNIEYKVHNVLRDKSGYYIIMDVEILGTRVTLANVYGPSNRDSPHFFVDVFNHIQQMDNDEVIVGGDWNCPLDTKLDTYKYTSSSNRLHTRNKIKEIMNENDLVDVWRELHPS